MNQAFNRDCLEAMKEFPDKFFDLAVVDPPYGINITSQSVHVEREREPQSAGAERLEVKRTQIGGGLLSRPKSTTPSTIKSLQMQSISLS